MKYLFGVWFSSVAAGGFVRTKLSSITMSGLPNILSAENLWMIDLFLLASLNCFPLWESVEFPPTEGAGQMSLDG